jgi:hypothetical protein
METLFNNVYMFLFMNFLISEQNVLEFACGQHANLIPSAVRILKQRILLLLLLQKI